MAEPEPRFAALLDDLAAEHRALDAVVTALSPAQWDRATPAEGWAVRDQIGHLHFFDEQAALAVNDPQAFAAGRDQAFGDFEGYEQKTLAFARQVEPPELLDTWRTGRAALLEAFGRLGGGERLEWYGPPMSAMSSATARLMETWAHGQDVVDAVGAGERWPATDRLRHIAHLGVRTRGFSYALRGEQAPAADIRVELTAPSGDIWEWGPEDATDRVSGPVVDFCLLVTQRRHRDDLALSVTGPAANEWVDIAQAFAGGVGTGRRPRS